MQRMFEEGETPGDLIGNCKLSEARTLGQQIFDELRRRRIGYRFFEGIEYRQLCRVDSRDELRQFYDRLGYDYVPAVGSPAQLVDHLEQRGHHYANSRRWNSTKDGLSTHFALGIGVCVTAFLVSWFMHGLGNAVWPTVGSVIAWLIITTPQATVYCIRRRRREELRAM